MGRSDQIVLPSRYQVVPRTLCFVTHEDSVLLLRGAPDKRIWPNKYNGLGGHVERGEDVFSAARREITEEAGIEVTNLRLCGVTNIETESTAGAGILLFTFVAQASSREVCASDEGELEWIPVSSIGNLDLVEDLHTILPLALSMRVSDPPYFARYTYDEQDRLRIEFPGVDGVS